MPRRKSSPQRRDADGVRKKQRSEIKLDKQITKLQNSTVPLIAKLPFSRLVKEIITQYKDSFRITPVAMVY